MVIFIPTEPGIPNMGHDVEVTSAIGNFQVGEKLNIKIMPMNGRRYKPGKGTDGKWLDKEGEPENRYMIFTGMGDRYAVATRDILDASFNEYKIIKN